MYQVYIYTGYSRIEFFCSTLHGAKCKARRIMRIYGNEYAEADIKQGGRIVTFCSQSMPWERGVCLNP